MIARIWSAQAKPGNAPAYAAHLQSRVLPELRTLAGYAGAALLQRATVDGVELVVITWWQSLEAIRGFAGVDLDGAVVAAEAATLLTRFDRRVRHYELVVQDPPGAS